MVAAAINSRRAGNSSQSIEQERSCLDRVHKSPRPTIRNVAIVARPREGQSKCSRRYLRTRVSPDYLRWLSEGAQEGAAHAVAIGKTCLSGDNVDRMATLLHHQASGLDAQVLDRLGRRLSGLGLERTAELARA